MSKKTKINTSFYSFLIRLGGLFLTIFLTQIVYSQNPQWIIYNTGNSPLPGNNINSIVVDNNNVKWIGTDSGTVRIEGNNWTIFDSSNIPFGIYWIRPLAIDSLNNLWFSYGTTYNTNGGMGVYNGVNWVLYNTTNSGLPSNRVFKIKIDSYNVKWICTLQLTDSNWIGGLAKYNDTSWIVYNTSNSGIPSNLVVSIDIKNNVKWIGTGGGIAKFNDTNWVVYYSQPGLPGGIPLSIVIDNISNVWVTLYGYGVSRYNKLTNDWTLFDPYNSGLSSAFCSPLIIKENIKWIGCVGGGLNRYDDTSWTLFKTYNSSLPDNTINSLRFDKLGNLWIGTYNGLAIYNPDGIIAVNKNEISVPEVFNLYQNYPNPFNPTTNIKFDIPKSALVKIIIYDINGKLVDILQNSMLIAGSYSINWDGSKYSSGVYFCRMITDDRIISRKMILLK